MSSNFSENGSGIAGPSSCATYVRFIKTKKNSKMLNVAKNINTYFASMDLVYNIHILIGFA
jgi:hypothetical protein